VSRRRKDSAGLNLDSLLDTLTNVVGFLVILLAFMQMGVGDAVERIRELTPEAFGLTDRDVEQAKRRAQEQAASRAVLEARQRQVRAEFDSLRQEQAAFKDESGQPLPLTAMSSAEAQRMVDQLKKKKPELEAEFATLDAELAHLLALLNQTPDAKAQPGTYVALPDPHPAEEGYEPAYFVCMGNRIICVNLPALQKAVKDRIEGNRSAFEWRDPSARRTLSADLGLKDTRREDKAAPKKAVVYDGKKIVAAFNEAPLAMHDFKVRVKTYDTSARLNILLEAIDGRGETKGQLASGHSKYGATVFNINSRKQKVYAQFLVFPDSFEVYLEARSLADKYQVPAGWHIAYDRRWETGLNQPIQVRQCVFSPPSPSAKTPAPKPPAKLLD
jgi:hypothetical protein